MKSTLIFVICLLAIANGKMTLEEIDQNKFGHTLLDTIQLQLNSMDVEDGALTGPVRTIYDMLIELRDQLYGEQESDTQGLETHCQQCTETIEEYTNKVEALKAQMVLDAGELNTLQESIDELESTRDRARGEVARVEALLKSLLDSHNEDVLEINELIADAQGVHDALARARQVIASGLAVGGGQQDEEDDEPVFFIQTNAATSIMAQLKGIDSKLSGYAKLGAQFVELATNEDIIADQDLVDSLLGAFDNLMESCIDDMFEMEKERTDLIADYEAASGALEGELLDAKTTALNSQTSYTNASNRLNQLDAKAGMDEADLEAWQQFVIDEGVRCSTEETAYNSRIAERAEQIRVLEEVIFLFETRFVEMNDYINTRVNLDEPV